jgi:hypothetical protein
MAGSDIGQNQSAYPAIITLVELKGSIDALTRKVDEDFEELKHELGNLRKIIYGLAAALAASGIITLPQVFGGG